MISLNLNNLILIENLIKSDKFAYFANLKLADGIRKSVRSQAETGGNLNTEENRSRVLEIIYENINHIEIKGEAFIESSSKLNMMFKEARKSIQNIK